MKTRELTRAAKAAKAIKSELKKAFPAIKFSVKSSNFSMGDSVDISYTDAVPTEQIEAITNKYQYGSFNSYEDMYENTNGREDIPQSKYVHVSRSKSDEAVKTVTARFNDLFTENCQITTDENGLPIWNDRNEGFQAWQTEVFGRAFRQFDFLINDWAAGSEHAKMIESARLREIEEKVAAGGIPAGVQLSLF